MQKNRTVLETFLHFSIYLTLAYLAHFFIFSDYYNLSFILSSLFLGSLFDMSVVYSFCDFKEIKFITNGVLSHPATEQTFKTGFVVTEEILQKTDLILFKLPLLIAIILTFSRSFKTVVVSIVIIIFAQLLYGVILAFDMMLTAFGKNPLLNIYLGTFGISESTVGFIAGTKIFFYAWFQKFLPFLIAYYLWHAGGYSFAKCKVIQLFREYYLEKLSLAKARS